MATPLTLRIVEYRARYFRRTWRGTVVSSFINPLLYLLSLGIGLGKLVDANLPGGVDGITFVAFVASGLLAAATMQSGAGEGMYPVLVPFKWSFTYEGQLATPLSIASIVNGHFIWIAVRLTMVAAAFTIVSVILGALPADTAWLGIFPAVLSGVAFSTVITAAVVKAFVPQALAGIQRFVVIPMFLFSGAFFPVDQLPGWVQPVTRVIPMWHGVELSRWLILGLEPGVAPWVSFAYLTAVLIAGWGATMYLYRWRLWQ